MQVQPRDRILELECGQGEISVVLASRAPEGMVVAMDSSPDRVRQARVRGGNLDNVMFLPGGAAEIPWKEGFFFQSPQPRFPRGRAL
jgi:ubiquinone/menaquinone biosynthesis C-methylase UbiE